MFACHLITYSLIIQSTITSNVTSIKEHSYSLTSPLLSFIPTICIAIMWWNTSSTVIITFITTHNSLPYMSTSSTTSLYIITQDLIGTPVLPSIFDNIPHILWPFRRFLYSAPQSLWFYVNFHIRYSNAFFCLEGVKVDPNYHLVFPKAPLQCFLP